MKPPRSLTRRRIPLGELLVEAGLITRQQLDQALQSQRVTGHRLGRVLVSMGLATPEAIARAVAGQLGIEFVELQAITIPDDVLTVLPETLIRRHQVIPIRNEGEALVLGMVDPLDILALDDIRRFLNRDLIPAAITLEGFQDAVNRYPALASSIDK
ncbi:MAG: hypothetical protein QN120_12175, partial [Armatimonadota bacterium]|nr:hypothetical protein [Armatimonadota bacterium]